MLKILILTFIFFNIIKAQDSLSFYVVDSIVKVEIDTFKMITIKPLTIKVMTLTEQRYGNSLESKEMNLLSYDIIYCIVTKKFRKYSIPTSSWKYFDSDWEEIEPPHFALEYDKIKR